MPVLCPLRLHQRTVVLVISASEAPNFQKYKKRELEVVSCSHAQLLVPIFPHLSFLCPLFSLSSWRKGAQRPRTAFRHLRPSARGCVVKLVDTFPPRRHTVFASSALTGQFVCFLLAVGVPSIVINHPEADRSHSKREWAPPHTLKKKNEEGSFVPVGGFPPSSKRGERVGRRRRRRSRRWCLDDVKEERSR